VPYICLSRSGGAKIGPKRFSRENIRHGIYNWKEIEFNILLIVFRLINVIFPLLSWIYFIYASYNINIGNESYQSRNNVINPGRGQSCRISSTRGEGDPSG